VATHLAPTAMIFLQSSVVESAAMATRTASLSHQTWRGSQATFTPISFAARTAPVSCSTASAYLWFYPALPPCECCPAGSIACDEERQVKNGHVSTHSYFLSTNSKLLLIIQREYPWAYRELDCILGTRVGIDSSLSRMMYRNLVTTGNINDYAGEL
jgi:hypothetical protein